MGTGVTGQLTQSGCLYQDDESDDNDTTNGQLNWQYEWAFDLPAALRAMICKNCGEVRQSALLGRIGWLT